MSAFTILSSYPGGYPAACSASALAVRTQDQALPQLGGAGGSRRDAPRPPAHCVPRGALLAPLAAPPISGSFRSTMQHNGPGGPGTPKLDLAGCFGHTTTADRFRDGSRRCLVRHLWRFLFRSQSGMETPSHGRGRQFPQSARATKRSPRSTYGRHVHYELGIGFDVAVVALGLLATISYLLS